MSSTQRNGRAGEITIVGAGIAGLVAAIACAEEGANVRLIEAHESLGGRGRSTDGPYKANLGPHAMYKDGAFWRWMRERDVLPAHASPRLTGVRLRVGGTLRRTPPLGSLPAMLRLRGREAPVATDFRTWAAGHVEDEAAAMLSSAAGVFTFHHDPGELSAAFVWPRMVRLLLTAPSIVRYPVGGWSTLVSVLEKRVRELGVTVEAGARVETLPAAPVIVATELDQARELLGDDSLRWDSGRTVCLDLGVRYRRGDPTIVSDLDESGWVGRYSGANPSIAPDGEELIQAQMPIRPGESTDQAALRLERLLDLSVEDWRARETWRRRQVMDGRSGALDMPGSSWRERPAVDRGDGVFLAGDMVAAEGLLAEVSWASAMEASRLALQALSATRPRLREVA
ncbi:MAG TPA: NAD(P)-binding protein [Solirubrobacteraceae bacterium]|nr:NAD(P)-binding protein [Solirubrobacteraceae bacterium]